MKTTKIIENILNKKSYLPLFNIICGGILPKNPLCLAYLPKACLLVSAGTNSLNFCVPLKPTLNLFTNNSFAIVNSIRFTCLNTLLLKERGIGE